jgi:hypothetical protein
MKSSSGTVLLMVLILSAIMYLIATTLLLITMTEVHIADFEQRSTQAFYAAESSVTLGLAKLRTNTDYRTNTSETTSIGGNTGLLNVQFYDGTDDGNGLFRDALSPSLYRLVLRGKGTIPGLNAATKRTVEREVVLKPFALFAQTTLTLTSGCTITGNIHGNSSVIIGLGNTVEKSLDFPSGDATSNGALINDGSVDGTESSLEPQISLPAFPIIPNPPTYHYKGKEYTAKPLVHDTLTLSPKGSIDPPAPSIELYSGFADPDDNPAGVFYPESEITGTLTALLVEGTVIIPPSYPTGTVAINGAVTITPVENFPALISAKDLNITLIGNLETFSDSLEKSQIQGLLYVQGNVSFTGNNTPGEIITGSILGYTITLTGNPVFEVRYDPAIISNPPLGIDLIELGEWREVFEN